MKKFLLGLAILAALVSVGVVQAKNYNSNDGDIKPNTANVLKSDLKQKVQIDETSTGNIVRLTGAKITEISGTTTNNLIKVKVFGQDYKVQIATDTNVVRQYWGKSAIDLSEFSVGDIIKVYGTLDTADYFLVHAKIVRNVSIQKLHAVFTGNILNIASSTGSFTIEAKRNGTSSFLVNTDSNTKIYQGKNLKSFSNLKVGTKVMVRGIWDKTLSKIQALLIRIKPLETEDDD